MTKIKTIIAIVAAAAAGAGLNELRHREQPAAPQTADTISVEATPTPRGVIRATTNAAVPTAAPEPKSTAVADSSANRLDIPDEYLKRGDKLIEELYKGASELESPAPEELERLARIDAKTARRLALRLALAPATAEQMGAILTEHANAERERVREAELEEYQLIMDFFSDNPEEIRLAAALEEMGGEQELTPEQKAFKDDIERQIEEIIGDVDVGHGREEEWHQNAEILANVKELLTTEQAAELDTYLEEDDLRDTEQRLYSRSIRLANQLALNEADRAELFDYLKANPKASNKDIAELLIPELGELLLN